MNKEDLKTGYSVELRNGNHYRVMGTSSGLKAIGKSEWCDLDNDWFQDLTNKALPSHDIVEVMDAPPLHVNLLHPDASGPLLWERSTPQVLPELPEHYRLMAVGEIITELCKLLPAGSSEWKVCTRGHEWCVGNGIDEEDVGDWACPDVALPEGYELWHVAGQPAPEESLPAGSMTFSRIFQEWSLSSHEGGPDDSPSEEDYERFHYAVPVAAPALTEPTEWTITGGLLRVGEQEYSLEEMEDAVKLLHHSRDMNEEPY